MDKKYKYAYIDFICGVLHLYLKEEIKKPSQNFYENIYFEVDGSELIFRGYLRKVDFLMDDDCACDDKETLLEDYEPQFIKERTVKTSFFNKNTKTEYYIEDMYPILTGKYWKEYQTRCYCIHY